MITSTLGRRNFTDCPHCGELFQVEHLAPGEASDALREMLDAHIAASPNCKAAKKRCEEKQDRITARLNVAIARQQAERAALPPAPPLPDLFPCPFDGEEALYCSTQRRHEFEAAVECSFCGVFKTGADAADAGRQWNTRAPGLQRIAKAAQALSECIVPGQDGNALVSRSYGGALALDELRAALTAAARPGAVVAKPVIL